MAQLLKITTKPIKIEMITQRAQLKLDNTPAKVTMETQRSNLNMESKNIKVRIDSYQSRRSMGLMNGIDGAVDQAEQGKQAASQGVANYTDAGNQMAQIHKGANIPDIMYAKMFKIPETRQVFLPSVGPEITWDPNELSMQYEPSRVQTQVALPPNQHEYVPGSIEFNVIQYPEVVIEYLGEPNYVPASSNPNK